MHPESLRLNLEGGRNVLCQLLYRKISLGKPSDEKNFKKATCHAKITSIVKISRQADTQSFSNKEENSHISYNGKEAQRENGQIVSKRSRNVTCI